tara:strand:- start:785 stop:2212 length:1428 start_codon:yes stop_codon:yes gene_type:complete
MKARITNQYLILLLFFSCILSRIATGIYYIEDIDSLRFALSTKEYDIVKLQPHFPGYPIFCLSAQILYYFLNNLGLSFSIIGGISIFIIIYFSLNIFQIQLNTFSGFCCVGIIFLNPLFWLMSNRYMPDLMGLSFSIMVLYLLIIKSDEYRYVVLGFLFTGLLAGIRLSYIPLLILPIGIHLLNNNKNFYLLLSLIFGCLIWFIPIVWMTGLNDLYQSAIKQTTGHFSDFGGTIITDGILGNRILSMIRSIWADGLGGYWPERSLQTLFISVPILYFSYRAINKKDINSLDKNDLIIIGSILIYIIWIFFFQNIIYKSRHILPLIIFCIIFINNGIQYARKKNKILNNVFLVIFFLGLINVTFVLVQQHTRPNAISSLKDNLISQGNKETIASISLINYYLKLHGLGNQFLDIENLNDIEKIKLLNKEKLILIGNFKESFQSDYHITHDSTYYHNPYVNRMWSEVSIYRLVKKIK